ncbi:MAG: PAS domain-containing protein [Candidatus Eremiobacteraeota bacterium]|nr:PAS domain-containing protein [Candidatus Eremiobacteraeota bacterium]
MRALPLGIILADLGGRITYANRAAGAIFGFDHKRARRMHIIEAVPSIELERRVAEAVAGEASTGPLIVTGKIVNRTYAVSAYPLTDEEGDTSGALVVAEDQTELLAVERARQEFLTNVSHELRTPLSSVKLMLETVMDAPDEETGDLFLPQALREVDRLAALVQRFLEQARTESGRLRLRYKRVRLSEVVDPIVKSFEPQAQGAGVELRYKVREDIEADVDRETLEQVVVNLIDNALRFTPADGTIKIQTGQDGNDAVLIVKDSGLGIPFKDLPHIFERFYVVDRSRARTSSGVGLGLSIVKQIVEAHHGSIVAESLLGSGAKFTCRFPMVAAVHES